MSPAGEPRTLPTLQVDLLAARSPIDALETEVHANGGDVADGSELSGSRGVNRYVHLDIFRIVGVCGVILAHESDDHVQANILLCQNWGMQYMFMIAGICWAFSSRPVGGYVLRLQVYFVIGTLCNWTAWVIKGLDWRSNKWDVVYQMWFAQFLSLAVLFTAPLKVAMAKPEAAIKVAVGYICVAALLIVLAATGFLATALADGMRKAGGSGADDYAKSTGAIVWHAARLVSTLAVSSIAIAALHRDGADDRNSARSLSWLPWVLLAMVYIPAIAVAEEFGAFVHDLQLFHIAIMIQWFSFAGQVQLAHTMRAYWPMIPFLLGLLAFPHNGGRLDLHPPEDRIQRTRWTLSELVLALLLLSFTPCRPLGNNSPMELCKDPYNVTGWLGRWALFAYMAHDAFLKGLPEPWGCLMAYGSASVFYLQEVARHRRASSGDETPTKYISSEDSV